MLKIRQARRELLTTKQECPLEVISFDRLERAGHRARLMNISGTGVGIQTSGRIEPGLVWFHERVNGHHSGVLVWCKQSGEHYRAGIKFVPLSREHEEYVHRLIAVSPLQMPLKDPEAVIRRIIVNIQQGAGGNA